MTIIRVEKFSSPYVLILREIINDPKLSDMDFRILCLLEAAPTKSASVNLLKQSLPYDPEELRASLEKLKKNGYISESEK